MDINEIRLYHMTHIDNLAGIIDEGGIWSDNDVAKHAPDRVRIGYSSLKEKRRKKPVGPIRPGAFIGDYVPFYFAPRSPMLFAIYKGGVAGYDQGQQPVIYLVSRIDKTTTNCDDWCFTDRHAVVKFAQMYEDVSYLEKVDWDVMNARMWKDTEEIPDKQERRQAEFLVRNKLPWEAIIGIAVFNKKYKNQVEDILANSEHKPSVKIVRGWYF